jgi:hypothetical protein
MNGQTMSHQMERTLGQPTPTFVPRNKTARKYGRRGISVRIVPRPCGVPESSRARIKCSRRERSSQRWRGHVNLQGPLFRSTQTPRPTRRTRVR